MGRTELIADAEQGVAAAERRFEAAEEEYVAARAALQGARARLGSLRASVEWAEDLTGLSRVDAVHAILLDASAPLGVGDVQEALVAAGWEPDSRNTVSSTLNHLKKSGRAVHLARGVWTAV